MKNQVVETHWPADGALLLVVYLNTDSRCCDSNTLTIGVGHQRDESAENALCDGRTGDEAGVIPAVCGSDCGDVEIPGGLRHKATFIQRNEIRKLVQHPAEGQIFC